MYSSTPAVAEAVAQLCREPPLSVEASARWNGTWEVVHAPHLRSVDALGVRFIPVRYVLSENGRFLRSDVHWSALGASGWLCAEGELSTSGTSVDLIFRSFWTSGDSAEPRDYPRNGTVLDQLVQAVGTLGFVASLSRFPVSYLDEELAVFSFPPLRTLICAKKQRAP
jgi:hypothetical protein